MEACLSLPALQQDQLAVGLPGLAGFGQHQVQVPPPAAFQPQEGLLPAVDHHVAVLRLVFGHRRYIVLGGALSVRVVAF